MRSTQRPNQSLKLRGDTWHYVRRVPKSVRHVDDRVLIYRSLETDREITRTAKDLHKSQTACRFKLYQAQRRYGHDEIGRDEARKIYRFWAGRVRPKDDRKPISGSSANCDLGNLGKLYRRYFEHIGDENRENPLRNLRFSAKQMLTCEHLSDIFIFHKGFIHFHTDLYIRYEEENDSF